MNQYIIKTISQHENELQIAWQDGHQSQFHYLWLRDNDARSQVSIGQNLNSIFHIPTAIRPATITLSNTLNITWEHDGKTSIIDPVWLRKNCYRTTKNNHNKLTLWQSANFTSGITPYDYQQLVHDKHVMRNMLYDFRHFGFVILSNVPTEHGMVLKVLQHFGYPRETHHDIMWDIKLQPTSEDIGDRNQVLPGHVDQPYRHPLPTVTLLHFITNQVTGGESTLVDGFYLAEKLRTEHSKYFQLLSTVPVTYLYQDEQTELQHTSPIINLDTSGAVTQVRMNPFSIQPFKLPPEQMEPFYQAYQLLGRMMEDKAHRLVTKMHSGNLLILDNLRILHGRLAYTNTHQTKRFVQGCFADQDNFWSKLAVLNRQLT